MVHPSFQASTALLIGLAVLGPAAAAAGSERPQSIPSIREWRPASGAFSLRRGSRILLSAHDRRRLRGTARVFREHLRRLTGRRLRVVAARRPRPRRGDLRLSLGARDPGLGGEGYRLALGRTARVAANTATGAFYGTRTILQMLRRGSSLPAGSGRDWPRYPERGLMVDIGRKAFTVGWLEERIRELAYLKLNYLHLHFTENLGWRIESERHPEVVSPNHLTKAQVRSLVALARRHHVTVVPEIDMPGHMGAALARHPELQLKDFLGQPNPNNLDYTLAAARAFARELVDEYLGLFPGPYFHVGADEYLFVGPVPLVQTPADYAPYPQLQDYARREYGSEATPKDGILGFLNSIDDLVRSRGKTMRVWNDGLGGGRAVRLHSGVIAEWWRDAEESDPEDLLAQGRRILNAGWYPTYYVNGATGSVPPRPDMAEVYQSWEPHVFRGPFYVNGSLGLAPHVVDPAEPRNLGSVLHVWNDDPAAATEEEITAGIFPRLRVLAQKTWGSARTAADYGEFQQVMREVGSSP
jgi:hexosaminidase